MNPKPASHRPKPLVLCILDGWGYRAERTDNALAQAHVPTWNTWMASYPHALLETSGLAVGLPDGQMGNSEVGHMNIGGGRVVMQTRFQVFPDPMLRTGSLDRRGQRRGGLAIRAQFGGAIRASLAQMLFQRARLIRFQPVERGQRQQVFDRLMVHLTLLS